MQGKKSKEGNACNSSTLLAKRRERQSSQVHAKKRKSASSNIINRLDTNHRTVRSKKTVGDILHKKNERDDNLPNTEQNHPNAITHSEGRQEVEKQIILRRLAKWGMFKALYIVQVE